MQFRSPPPLLTILFGRQAPSKNTRSKKGQIAPLFRFRSLILAARVTTGYGVFHRSTDFFEAHS
jgi:hypothetical protein